jgi:hypothetical protein
MIRSRRHPLSGQDADDLLAVPEVRVRVQADSGAGGELRTGAGTQDSLLGKGDGHGSDFADDAGTDARVADSAGDLGDRSGRQLVGAQPGDRGWQSAFEVEAGALDDVQAGPLGHLGDPGKIGPDPDARHVDQAPAAGVLERLDLGDRQLGVVEPQVVAQQERVAAQQAEQWHVHPGVRVDRAGHRR